MPTERSTQGVGHRHRRRCRGRARQPGAAAAGRCADAQDIFVAGRTARVAAVHQDVDGNTHIAVVVEDDPAAELHDWYGRYLYFAPEEVEPSAPNNRARKEAEMEVIGWIATIAVALVVLAGVLIGVRSIPDIQRYMRMRHM